MEELIHSYDVKQNEVVPIIEKFIKEMKYGLEGKPSSLCMISSYIDVPTGKDEDISLAVDFGGTNLRCLLLKIEKAKVTILAQKKMKIDPATRNGEILFDNFAQFIIAFLDENKSLLGNAKPPLTSGFVFSFPIRQTRIAHGRLLFWGKEFITEGVIGKDVVSLLDKALKKRGLDWLEINVLCNDTVGTIATVAIEDPTAQIGIIIGTGTNACYRERAKNILKKHGNSDLPISSLATYEENNDEGPEEDVNYKGSHMLINTEWGGFTGFPNTVEDLEIQHESAKRHEQIFEKKISGKYLGLLVRKCIRNAISKGWILRKLVEETKVFFFF
jgi:hexokinase